MVHIIAQPVQPRTIWGSHLRWIASNRESMNAVAPFASMSSVPSTCSAMNPYISALVALMSLFHGTVTPWSRASPTNVITMNTVIDNPTIHVSRHKSTRIPASSNPLPTTLIIIDEKKFDKAVTSPSILSMSSPGLVPLWKPMSR